MSNGLWTRFGFEIQIRGRTFCPHKNIFSHNRAEAADGKTVSCRAVKIREEG
jgi:hypothetical protein